MALLFPPVSQLGYMSCDIDRSMHYFIETMGIGPWYVLRQQRTSMLYRGEPTECVISLALANCGDIQFEIVEQHNDAPSLYREALAATPALHIQHMGVWTDDYARTCADALARGWEPVFETAPNAGASCFVVHPSEPGICIEISDCDPYKNHVRQAVREVAQAWDGSDPIREGLPPSSDDPLHKPFGSGAAAK